MLALGASVEQLQPILSAAQFKSCQVACISSPTKAVVSGPVINLHVFRDHLQSEGFLMTLLEIIRGLRDYPRRSNKFLLSKGGERVDSRIRLESFIVEADISTVGCSNSRNNKVARRLDRNILQGM